MRIKELSWVGTRVYALRTFYFATWALENEHMCIYVLVESNNRMAKERFPLKIVEVQTQIYAQLSIKLIMIVGQMADKTE